MLILLTGATGLIGSQIGKHLVTLGHEIRTLSRNPTRSEALCPFPAEHLKWDAESDSFPENALTGVDAVIHLAGEPLMDKRWTRNQKERIYHSRVNGTKKIVEKIKEQFQHGNKTLKIFIGASAVGIYGTDFQKRFDESSPPGNDELAKLGVDWEAPTKDLASLGIRVVNLRIGLVLSRLGGVFEKLMPMMNLNFGSALGSGKQGMSWIHIDDLISAIDHCLINETMTGPVNAVAPNPVCNRDFMNIWANIIQKFLLPAAPAFMLKIVLGERANVLLKGQFVFPKRLLGSGFDFKYSSLNEALIELCLPYQKSTEVLIAEQWVPKTVKEIFPFFCDEKNLEQLTPKFLNFNVLQKSTQEIQKGTLIDYRLSLNGIPFKWRTLIEEWVPNERFVDTQIKGPYALWHHTHEFIPLKDGTLLRDTIRYKVPLGFLGAVFAGWKVRANVIEIFNYRRKKVHSYFYSDAF